MTTARDMLIETVEATGGAVTHRDGTHGVAAGREWRREWVDLAKAYFAACREAGKEPMVSGCDYCDDCWQNRIVESGPYKGYIVNPDTWTCKECGVETPLNLPPDNFQEYSYRQLERPLHLYRHLTDDERRYIYWQFDPVVKQEQKDAEAKERSKPRNRRRRLLQQWAIGIGVTVVLILAFWINADYEAARQARQDLRHIYAYADYQPQWRYYLNPAHSTVEKEADEAVNSVF